MKSVKKLIALTLTAVLTASLFTGCAAKKSTVNAGKTTLTIALWDYQTTNYSKHLLDAYKTANPNVDLKIIDIPASQYDQKLAVDLAGNVNIDVLFVKDFTAYGGMVFKNQLMPLDDLIKKDNLDTKPYGTSLNNSKMNGKIYGLPYRNDSTILYYNKDLFDKAKVTYPTANMTWNDYKATAKKLTSGQGAAKIYGAYIQPWSSQFTLLGLQKGLGDDINGDYSMHKDGFDLLNQMQTVDKSVADYATNVSTGANYKGSFEKGNVGMVNMGQWFMQSLAQDKAAKKYSFNWDIAPVPTWDGKNGVTTEGPTPTAINSKTKNKDAAWNFVKFVAGKQGAMTLAKDLITPAYIDSDVMKTFTDNPALPTDAKDILSKVSASKKYMDLPADKLNGFIGQMITEEVQLIMTGNKTVDKGIAEMTQRRVEIQAQNK